MKRRPSTPSKSESSRIPDTVNEPQQSRTSVLEHRGRPPEPSDIERLFHQPVCSVGSTERIALAAESAGSGGTPETTCEYCGTVIETSEWYPVTKERDDDGELQFYSFCSERCQVAWLDR